MGNYLQKNGDNPLFLPEGSVRGIVTLLLVLSLIATIFVRVEAPTAFYDFVKIALIFYFVTRVSGNRKPTE